MIDQVILNEVQQHCSTFQSNTTVEVSNQAQELIALLVTSIVSDPHPRWRMQQAPQQTQSDYLAALQFNLARLVADESISSKITTFHLIHWIADTLASLCTIKKS